MRLVSFGGQGQEKPGVLQGDKILDLCCADPSLPNSMLEIIEQGLHGRLQELVAHVADLPAQACIPLEGTRLGPPITNPSKIVCIGLNYADHAAEQNKPLPESPLLFAKAPTALCGHGDPIILPKIETKPDIEAELAFVVRRRAKHVRAEDWQDYVAGYMCFNDVSGRQAQYSDQQWFRGKSYDSFAPCGPFLLTADELADPHHLSIGSQVDDFIMQQSNTDQLVIRVPQLIEYITRSMTLMPGDIVATGTPPGVGVFRDPPRFLAPGNRVTIKIERLGTLSNPVQQEGT